MLKILTTIVYVITCVFIMFQVILLLARTVLAKQINAEEITQNKEELLTRITSTKEAYNIKATLNFVPRGKIDYSWTQDKIMIREKDIFSQTDIISLLTCLANATAFETRKDHIMFKIQTKTHEFAITGYFLSLMFMLTADTQFIMFASIVMFVASICCEVIDLGLVSFIQRKRLSIGRDGTCSHADKRYVQVTDVLWLNGRIVSTLFTTIIFLFLWAHASVSM